MSKEKELLRDIFLTFLLLFIGMRGVLGVIEGFTWWRWPIPLADLEPVIRCIFIVVYLAVTLIVTVMLVSEHYMGKSDD